jgi:broad specificity phosphatase PhoE
MNKARARALGKVRTGLAGLLETITGIRDEEQDYYDNMPEAFQDGRPGEKAQEHIDRVEEVIASIEDAMGALEEYDT